jgi:hypothetical protein
VRAEKEERRERSRDGWRWAEKQIEKERREGQRWKCQGEEHVWMTWAEGL